MVVVKHCCGEDKMKLTRVMIMVFCLSLPCIIQSAPYQVKLKTRPRLPQLKLQLLNSFVNQALTQETEENEEMVKTYCKLTISLVKAWIPTFVFDDNNCNSINDEVSLPEDGQPNKEEIYKWLLNVLRELIPNK